jgi:serine/threonine-protein kinase
MIPDRMKAAIMRAMSKNRDERQADVNAFFQELNGASAGPVQNQFAAGSTGTAAMAAVPAAFEPAGHSGTVAGNIAMPAPQPQYGAPPPVQALPTQAPYSAPAKSGGGKGPLVALAAVVGIGVIVGLVFAIKAATKKTDDDPGALTGLNSGAAAPATIAPLPPDSSNPIPADSTAIDGGHVAKVGPTTAGATTPASTAKGPQGEEACQESAKQARQGNIEAAVGLYHACQNGGRSAPAAKSAIEQNAGPAARRKKFNGDCVGARRIAASAQSIGAAGTAPTEAASCK